MAEYYAALEETMSNATVWRYDLRQKLHVVNMYPEIPLFPIGNIPPISWYREQGPPGTKPAGERVFLGFPERSVSSDHLRLEEFHPAGNDAPDWVEIMASLGKTRGLIDQALRMATPATVKARIVEDEYLFRYGEWSLHLYDHLLRMLLTHDRARQKTELEAAKPFAEKLRHYTLRNPRAGSPNGLVAMGLEAILKAYSKKLEAE
jgi:hypothetical protein